MDILADALRRKLLARATTAQRVDSILTQHIARATLRAIVRWWSRASTGQQRARRHTRRPLEPLAYRTVLSASQHGKRRRRRAEERDLRSHGRMGAILRGAAEHVAGATRVYIADLGKVPFVQFGEDVRRAEQLEQCARAQQARLDRSLARACSEIGSDGDD
jgi:hypothetical protein